MNKIIVHFDISVRAKIIDVLIDTYNNYYNNSLHRQIEATDLFLTMIKQIKAEDHVKYLKKYYDVYLNKNIEREREIMNIDEEYQENVNKIDFDYTSEVQQIEKQYQQDLNVTELNYYKQKTIKNEYRLKGLYGIVAGIIIISFLAIILVFFAIQRSVKKIEEKLTKE